MSDPNRVRCDACEGTGRVAIIRAHDAFARSVPQLCNRPMAVTVARARALLQGYRSRDVRGIVVRSMADRLSATGCPCCGATGFTHTLVFGETHEEIP